MGNEKMKLKMNKKGALVLRDVMFMMIIFSAMIAFGSIAVMQMANEYENTDMESEYGDLGVSSLGKDALGNLEGNLTIMANKTEEASGSFALVTGAIKGVGTILSMMIRAPITIKNSLILLMNAIRIPPLITFIVGNMIMLLMYSLVIFVIVSSLLKGGKV